MNLFKMMIHSLHQKTCTLNHYCESCGDFNTPPPVRDIADLDGPHRDDFDEFLADYIEPEPIWIAVFGCDEEHDRMQFGKSWKYENGKHFHNTKSKINQ